MLLIDPEAAVAAIPRLMPDDGDVRRKTVATIREVLSARGEIAGETANRLQRIAQLLGVETEPKLVRPADEVAEKPGMAKAS